MPNDLVLILTVGVIAAVVLAIVLAIVVAFIVRLMRGKITLTLPRTAFNPGDTIAGSFELKTRKPVEGQRLYVALIGQQVSEVPDGDGTRTQTREAYRDEQTLEEARAYEAGGCTRYEFELNVPSIETPEFLQGGLGQAIKIGAQFLGGGRRYWRWKVVARLEAKGADLVASKKVSVNMGF